MGRFGRAFWGLMDRSAARNLNRAARLAADAGGHESRLRALADAELTAAVAELSADGDPLAGNDKLALFLAMAREASRRAIDLRPFDVQLSGAARMLAGDVVEMATGEGKTLSGAIAAAGFALRGRSVQVISVNDYLARRDAEWMGPLYELLGVSVGWIGATSTWDERRAAYGAQVTYGSVSEIGFDQLRDRLRTSVDELLDPESDVALIDEADSVLVDEALVPLVLAGAAESVAPEQRITDVVRRLKSDVHYQVDTDGRTVSLTDAGIAVVEAALDVDLYAAEHAGTTLSQVNVALHAHALLQRDVHYIVRDGQVHLINESRGRIAHLQRWPDGLHAAVEAKEGLDVSESGEILDSMTVQALIGRYRTVCGMTGTAVAAERQLRTFYKLEVSRIPPNKPCVREDEPDRVYVTRQQARTAIVEYILEIHETGQPILIGTLDVAESERLAVRLRRVGVPCSVLNAKNDAAEAAVIAEAAAFGAVTVSTQLAGRGIDIRPGGADQHDAERVIAAGGLCVIGTGRHVSSRLDNQLRGRCGRQGDPGRSVFFASLEDDLVVRHATDMELPEIGDSRGRLTAAEVGRIMEHAQLVAEAQMLEIHTNTWRYNQVIEQQRALIGQRRDRVLRTDQALRDLEDPCAATLVTLRAEIEESVIVEAARLITLFHLDRCWAEHLAYLADVREGIHLHAVGRNNPLDEFHRVAIPAFTRDVADNIRTRAIESFDDAVITSDGVDLVGLGLKRPSATWTYMVRDNPFEPFESGIERSVRNLRTRSRQPTTR